MKKLFYLISIIFITSSCIEINFENPQPAGIANEKTIPETIWGKYLTGDDDTLIISENRMQFIGDTNAFNIDLYLSDSLIIRTLGKRYFVNIKADSSFWSLYILKKNKANLDVLTIYTDSLPQIETMKKITKVKEVYHKSGTLDMYIVDPTQKELKRMIKKGVFISMGTFYKID